MSGRNQSVKVNGSLTSPMPLSFGVPQGSVFGPLVVILYTHPLSKLIYSFKNISRALSSPEVYPRFDTAIIWDFATLAIPDVSVIGQPSFEVMDGFEQAKA